MKGIQGIALVFALALCGTAFAAVITEKMTLPIPSLVGKENQAVNVSVTIPSAGENVPAMVIVPSSVGVSEVERSYADMFVSMGVAAAIMDSFSGRGVKTTIFDQFSVTDAQMTVDALNVLQSIVNHPKIASNRIGIIGFSKGGAVALRTSLIEERRKVKTLTSDKFVLHIGMYPGCGRIFADMRSTGAPVWMLLGDKDRTANPQTCREYAERVRQAGGNVQVISYQAEHGWNFPGPSHWTQRKAQNYFNCIFEDKEGGLVERKSGVRIMSKQDLITAQSSCMTMGTSGGYNAEVSKESRRKVKELVFEVLVRNKS